MIAIATNVLSMTANFVIVVLLFVLYIFSPKYGGELCTGEEEQIETCKSEVRRLPDIHKMI